jgi:hypothetical protein
MIIPAHTANATAGFGSHKEVKDPRFEYGKISLFHDVKEKGYHFDDDLWTRVYDLADARESESSEEHPKQSKRSPRRRSGSDRTTASMQDRFAQLQKTLLREFTGPFPIAKINIFKVYLACVQIAGIISDKMHEDMHRGSNCMCFAEVLLNAADQYKENEHKLHPFGCKELVETCKNAIAQVLGQRKLDEFFGRTYNYVCEVYP